MLYYRVGAIMKYHHHSSRGFTIVELLIVIVIIAILATVVIVSYRGLQNRAYDASVESDIATFRKKVELIKIDASDGLYPASFSASDGLRFSKGAYLTGRNNFYYCASTDRLSYAVGLQSKSGKNYQLGPDGSMTYPGNVGAATTCIAVGKADGNTAQMAMTSNGTTDTWATWAN